MTTPPSQRKSVNSRPPPKPAPPELQNRIREQQTATVTGVEIEDDGSVALRLQRGYPSVTINRAMLGAIEEHFGDPPHGVDARISVIGTELFVSFRPSPEPKQKPPEEASNS